MKQNTIMVICFLFSLAVAQSAWTIEIDSSDIPLNTECFSAFGTLGAVEAPSWGPLLWNLDLQTTVKYWSPNYAGMRVSSDGKVILRFVLSDEDIRFLSRRFSGTDTRIPFALEIDVGDKDGAFGQTGQEDYSVAGFPSGAFSNARLVRDVPFEDPYHQLSAVIMRPDKLLPWTVYEVVFTPNHRTADSGRLKFAFQLTVNYKWITAMRNGTSTKCDLLKLMGDLNEQVAPEYGSTHVGGGDVLVSGNFGSEIPSTAYHPWYFFLAARIDSSNEYQLGQDDKMCWDDTYNPAHNDSGSKDVWCHNLLSVSAGSYYNRGTPYRQVARVAWYPPNRSCAYADKWLFYDLYGNVVPMFNADICGAESDSMVAALGENSQWWDIIYGPGDLNETGVCSQ